MIQELEEELGMYKESCVTYQKSAKFYKEKFTELESETEEKMTEIIVAQRKADFDKMKLEVSYSLITSQDNHPSKVVIVV